MFKSLIRKNNFRIVTQTLKNFSNEQTKNFRVEYDTFGPVNVPVEKYWAAQTQRSLQNFAIGTKEDKMPLAVVKAMAIVKKAAAKVKNNYKILR
jgi:fumarate hydratase class II